MTVAMGTVGRVVHIMYWHISGRLACFGWWCQVIGAACATARIGINGDRVAGQLSKTMHLDGIMRAVVDDVVFRVCR